MRIAWTKSYFVALLTLICKMKFGFFLNIWLGFPLELKALWMSYATGLSCLKDGYINHYIVESPGEVGIIHWVDTRHYLRVWTTSAWVERSCLCFVRCLVKCLKAMSLPSHEYNNYFVKLNLFRHKKDVYLRWRFIIFLIHAK